LPLLSRSLSCLYQQRPVREPLGLLSVNRCPPELPERQTLPIRLSPTATKCGVDPFAGVQPVKSRGVGPAGDSEQRAERVEGIEAPIESERELVEIGL